MKHSIFTRIIAIALVVLSVMAISIPAYAVSHCTTSKSGVNVRKSANSGSDRICQISNTGTAVDVLCEAVGTTISGSSSTKWYYVRVAGGSNAGKYGYIHSSLVSGFSSNDLDRPSSKSEAFGPSLLKSGSKGSEVRNVQYVLYLEGYLDEDEIDGAFGSKTTAALEKYQRAHFGYGADWEPDPADGIAGDQTKTEMWNDHENALKQNGFLYD